MDRDRFAGTDRSDPLVGLALDADPVCRDAQGARHVRAHRVDVRHQFWTLRDHHDVDVDDGEAGRGDDLGGARQQRKAVRTFPRRIGVRKMAADIASTGTAQDGVGDSVTDSVGILMPV